MEFINRNIDKLLLWGSWACALGATLFVAYHPPAENAVVLQMLMSMVTGILTALLALINPRGGAKDGN